MMFHRNGRQTVALSLKVAGVRKWSAETPHLYTLVLTLSVPGNPEAQSESTRVGFRVVEIKDGRVMVNGQPIIVQGVNRHEHDPVNGKVRGHTCGTSWESSRVPSSHDRYLSLVIDFIRACRH